MKTIYVKSVPACDICKQATPFVYDIPTRYGSWAYVCQGCRPKVEVPASENIGTRIEKHEREA